MQACVLHQTSNASKCCLVLVKSLSTAQVVLQGLWRLPAEGLRERDHERCTRVACFALCSEGPSLCERHRLQCRGAQTLSLEKYLLHGVWLCLSSLPAAHAQSQI